MRPAGGLGGARNTVNTTMVKRRKMLIGLGALAAGGAAATGTGAFSAQANRDMAIDVEGDGSAYVGIEASDSPNVKTSNGTVSLDLASDSGDGGSGINKQGQTLIRPAFTLRNQGDQTLYVEIDNPLANTDMTSSATNGELANGNIDVNVPKGFDFQFVAVDELPAKKDVALIGRGTEPDSSLGGDFDAPYSNEFYYPIGGGSPSTNSGNRRPLTKEGTAGAIELGTGEAVPIVVRAVASEDVGSVPEVDFTVEAYSDQSSLTYDTVANPASTQQS
jgi:hypothetical protein